MTAHFIDKDWIRHDFPIGLAHFELDEKKTGINIAAKIESMLEKFQIGKERVIGMLRDGAPNMKKAADDAKIER